jgi:L-aspartate oxidase
MRWERVGIIRCASSLGEALERLSEWRVITERDYVTRRELELKNMLTLAGIIVHAAISRKGSVGAHYRSDFKERGERWQEHLSWDRQSLDMRN